MSCSFFENRGRENIQYELFSEPKYRIWFSLRYGWLIYRSQLSRHQPFIIWICSSKWWWWPRLLEIIENMRLRRSVLYLPDPAIYHFLHLSLSPYYVCTGAHALITHTQHTILMHTSRLCSTKWCLLSSDCLSFSWHSLAHSPLNSCVFVRVEF